MIDRMDDVDEGADPAELLDETFLLFGEVDLQPALGVVSLK